MLTKELLFQECRFVRDVAEEIYDDKNNGLDYMRIGTFPSGWCGVLSNVLCVWLGQKFTDEEFFYVYGSAGRQTHAWVKYKNMIIDITADQFKNCSEEIMIVEEGKSPLHRRFKVEYPPIKKGTSEMRYQPEKYIYEMLIQKRSNNQ